MVMQENGDRTAVVLHIDSDDGTPPLLAARAPTPVLDNHISQDTETWRQLMDRNIILCC